MGEPVPVRVLVFLLLLTFACGGSAQVAQAAQGHDTPLNNTAYVKACEAECRRCNIGAVGRGRCLSQCPAYRGGESPCTPPTKLNEITIGCAVGILLCIMVGVTALLCVKLRRRRRDGLPKQSAKALKNFHKDLDRLRPHAYTFLGILNNVRRQVREMHRAGNTDAAVICLRSISDLAKLLMLLNKRDVPIVPPDWPRLLSWAERLLERTNISLPPPPLPHPQVAQLIRFLQTPQKSSGSTSASSSPMSSMKPFKYDSCSESREFRDIPMKEEWKQQSGKASSWQNTSHSSWLDDDFSLINFRPQDEIVTVL